MESLNAHSFKFFVLKLLNLHTFIEYKHIFKYIQLFIKIIQTYKCLNMCIVYFIISNILFESVLLDFPKKKTAATFQIQNLYN